VQAKNTHRLTIDIPLDLWHFLNLEAKRQRSTRTRLCILAIESSLAQYLVNSAGSRTEQSSAVKVQEDSFEIQDPTEPAAEIIQQVEADLDKGKL
jgi:hypothetical protein